MIKCTPRSLLPLLLPPPAWDFKLPTLPVCYTPRPVVAPLMSQVHLTPEQDRAIAAQWDYPSDHLLLRATVMGLRVGTWNILNPQYIGYLDRPGWKTSPLVMSNHQLWDHSQISVRQHECASKVYECFFGKKPLDVLCLQECSSSMLRLLRERLPSDQVALFHQPNGGRFEGDPSVDNHVVTLFRPSSFVGFCTVTYPVLFRRYYKLRGQGKEVLGWDRWRPAVDTKFVLRTDAGLDYCMRLFNIHISTAGRSPKEKLERMTEVVDGISQLKKPDENVVIIGDTNASSAVRNQVPLLADKGVVSLSGQPSQVDNKALVAEDIDAIYFWPAHESHGSFVKPNCFLASKDAQTSEVYAKTLHPIIMGYTARG